MNLFLIDTDIKKSYDQLFQDINASKHYCKVFKSESLYDFFLNFIIGLISGKPLILLDSDISDIEIKKLDIDDAINTQVLISINKIENFEHLIEQIQNTTSEIIIFTSGTTGQPKKITHKISSLSRAVRFTNNKSNVVWGFAYNPTHIAGLQVFLQALFNKNTIVNLFNKNRTIVYDSVLKYQITHISATPTFFRLLLPIEKSYFSVIRLTFGGEKSDEKLYNKMLQLFPNAKINNIYASTEAGTLLISKGEKFQIPTNILDKIIVLDNELLIHKSLLGLSRNIILKNDYYHTGDLVEWVDEIQGIFRFLTRKNELINIGGYKVNPSEVEDAILEYPNVKQVLVYGKSNSVLGNILCAEIQIFDKILVSEIDIRKFLSGKLQDFKIPRKIYFVENISLTRTGKIKRV